MMIYNVSVYGHRFFFGRSMHLAWVDEDKLAEILQKTCEVEKRAKRRVDVFLVLAGSLVPHLLECEDILDVSVDFRLRTVVVGSQLPVSIKTFIKNGVNTP